MSNRFFERIAVLVLTTAAVTPRGKPSHTKVGRALASVNLVHLAISLALATGLCHAQNTISTYAGTSNCCAAVDGGPATSAWISVGSLATDKQGNLYIWDTQFSKVRKVSPSGIITTVAGNGTPGYTGDGGPATSAELFASGHGGLAVDGSGNLYISDGQNQVVRKVNAAGIISTFAGTGAPGFSGDGGPANKAQLFYPAGLALDGAGNLYIADSSNNRVRMVNTAGIITTVAGNGNVSYSGDSVQATTTAVDRPEDLTVDNAGNLYIAETSDSRVRKVNASGIISTIAGQTKKTGGFSGDGGPATAATLRGPLGMAVDPSGNLYIADNGNGRVRKVDAAGIITTFAGITGNASSPLGDGGPATSARPGVGERNDCERRSLHIHRHWRHGGRAVQRHGNRSGQLQHLGLGLTNLYRSQQAAHPELDRRRGGPDLHSRQHLRAGGKGCVEQ